MTRGQGPTPYIPFAGWHSWIWSSDGRVLSATGPRGVRQSFGEVSVLPTGVFQAILIDPHGRDLLRCRARSRGHARAMIRDALLLAGGQEPDGIPSAPAPPASASSALSCGSQAEAGASPSDAPSKPAVGLTTRTGELAETGPPVAVPGVESAAAPAGDTPSGERVSTSVPPPTSNLLTSDTNANLTSKGRSWVAGAVSSWLDGLRARAREELSDHDVAALVAALTME